VIAVAVALAAAPSVFLLVFFDLKDRYEPEPRGHVAAAFLFGALAVVPALGAAFAVEQLLGREWLALGGWLARAAEAWLEAGLAEEGAKWLALFATVWRWHEFDEPLDGVVYGVALALGFATVENVLCVVRDGLGIGLLRALFAVPAHALFGAAMGFYFGRAKLGRGRFQAQPVTPAARRLGLGLALAAPVAFHGLYDFALMALHGAWMYALVSALSLALWVFVLRRVHRAQDDSPFRDPP
jgi:RsiW-degrading membrane proteinase PrsW (M82 family)